MKATPQHLCTILGELGGVNGVFRGGINLADTCSGGVTVEYTLQGDKKVSLDVDLPEINTAAEMDAFIAAFTKRHNDLKRFALLREFGLS